MIDSIASFFTLFLHAISALVCINHIFHPPLLLLPTPLSLDLSLSSLFYPLSFSPPSIFSLSLSPLPLPPPPPPPGGDLEALEYHALFSFHSETEGDLSFQEGDTVLVYWGQDNGWWFGSAGGQQGWFPESYVQVSLCIHMVAVCMCVVDHRWIWIRSVYT